ncbi:MAG: methylated-DNA--[protein]-cysteine S-methyltransferase, partial [Pseudonocardiaceae bacterium]
VQVAVVASAVGPLAVEAGEDTVRRVRFGAERTVPDAAAGSLASRAAAELGEYFAGARTAFDVRPDWSLLDETAARVLATLVEIAPFGRTVSYGELAAAAGLQDPVASRAVGQVLNANPWPVLVPCHRVVMADGSLGGFGGGVWRKEALLRLEGVLPATLWA